MLEGRALMSNIPGVTFQFGNIAINATQASHNVAQVSINPIDHKVQVSLNGQSEEFSPSQVFNVTYKGGSGGGDTFTNNTNLVELAYVHGTGNHLTGGTSFNYAFFLPDGSTTTPSTPNTYDVQAGSFSDVWGSVAINNPSHATVQYFRS